MAFHTILLIAYAATWMSSAEGSRPGHFAIGPLLPVTGDRPECQEVQQLVCMGPWMAFTMPPEPGMQLFDANIDQFRGVLPESAFHRFCRIAQDALSCFADWMKQCAPSEIAANIKIPSKALHKILSFCNETDSYSKFMKIRECAAKIREPAGPCVETWFNVAGRQFHEELMNDTAVGESRQWRDSSAGFVFTIPNLQEYACCYGKKIKECLEPKIRSGCTPDEQSVTENFLNTALQAFECTDDLYRNCYTNRSPAFLQHHPATSDN